MFRGIDISTLTIRLPAETAQRLRALAQSRGLSVNKLMEQFSARALSAWDIENYFRAMAATGDLKKVLAVLDRLDTTDATTTQTQTQ
jgi:hypothetical protein